MTRRTTDDRRRVPWTAALLGMAVGAFSTLPGCGNDGEDLSVRRPRSTGPFRNAAPETRRPTFDGSPLDRPMFKTIPVKVYTPDPGFFVLIDGEPARNEQGRRLKTPCEIELLPGNHNVAVVREKYADTAQEVLISASRTLEFHPTYEPFAEARGYFASRFANADAGHAAPLANLNTEGPVWDPFVSADGLTVWFAGNRQEGRGIYVASRTSINDDFSKPGLLLRNADAPASPSVTADRRIVAYTVPGKAQVRALVRDDAEGPFRQGTALAFSERDGEEWLSCHLSAEGRTLYTAQDRRGKQGAYVARRTSTESAFDAKWEPFALPGMHPCLSHDGLRQYVFDGERLLRSSRRSQKADFSEPALVAELELKNFVRRPEYRQYCVSEDEQWLYYTDDPVQSGNLWVVKLSNGPGWGYAPRGKSIPQIELAKTDGEPETTDKPANEAAKSSVPNKNSDSDPDRLLPLPYAVLRTQFQAALSEGDAAAAERLLARARADARFDNDRDVLAWDEEELQHARGFWNRLREALENLKPGDVLRLGGVQVEFTSFQNDTIRGTAKGSGKEYSRPLPELIPNDLAMIVDRRIDRNDETAQLQIGTFLALGEKSSPQLVNARLRKAGAGGRLHIERQSGRKLHILEREFARENIAAGLQLLDALVAADPKSDTAAKALALKEKLHTQQEWRAVGSRRWKTEPAGEYATAGSRSLNSFLLSAREYENFHLELEWKTTEEVAQGGIWFHFNGQREIRGNAFKIHLANDHDLRDQPDRFSTGSLFGIKGPTENPIRRQGEWNSLRMTVRGDRVQVAINGVPVLDTPATDTNIRSKGYVCLDGEIPGITYRRVLVYELPR